MLSTLVALVVLTTSSNLSGVWRGIFNDQPGPYSTREVRTPFRLRLQFDSDGRLTGTVTVLNTNRTAAIRNATCDKEGCSFEVDDNPDEDPQAWRIGVEHGKLVGIRNKGPIGGMGIGIGVRLFRIDATREPSAIH